VTSGDSDVDSGGDVGNQAVLVGAAPSAGMEFDLGTAAFGIHAAIGAFFLVLAASNLASGSLAQAALQGGMAVMLLVLGVAVGRVIRRKS
jgi:hypothetical protein